MKQKVFFFLEIIFKSMEEGEGDGGKRLISEFNCGGFTKTADILKIDFFAQSKLEFWNFAQENLEKSHLKSHNMCERLKEKG